MSDKLNKRRDFFKELCTDKSLEEQGAWVYLPDFEGSVLVVRWGNPNFTAALRAAMKPFKRFVDNRGGFLPDTTEDVKKQVAEVTARIVAAHILKDIKDFYADDKPIANTVENKTRMLMDDDFFENVAEASKMRETYRAIEREEETKNLKTPSAGSSTTPQG